MGPTASRSLLGVPARRAVHAATMRQVRLRAVFQRGAPRRLSILQSPHCCRGSTGLPAVHRASPARPPGTHLAEQHQPPPLRRPPQRASPHPRRKTVPLGTHQPQTPSPTRRPHPPRDPHHRRRHPPNLGPLWHHRPHRHALRRYPRTSRHRPPRRTVYVY